ncbi:hypothetical protein A3K70_00015 [Candidatus Bathyarchaeota archaeon RBG_16_48_13]|nr:MAG: hypothetical protein A3K70_00015 [Candidatus Bathyarchaeota archaeon RBG_16_48_13]
MFARSALYLYQLRKNLRLESAELAEINRKKLRAMIKHAYENVPFYHRKFSSVGIKPDDIKSISDLSKVPVTTKYEIQSSSFDDIVASNVGVNGCTARATSGSLGIPLSVFFDEETLDFEAAVWNRAYLENGLRLTDKMAIIRLPRFFPKGRRWYETLGISRRKYISVFDDPERQLELLEDFKPDVIKGYSSSLAILSDFCRKRASFSKPRLVFTGSESMDDRNRKLISSVFEAEPLDYYGCIEFSLLAWECREHMGYHMNTDSVMMEFVENQEEVSPGERGEIVCTSLVNHAMPLIRYRLEDVGIPVEEQCSCGRTLPLLKKVEGRMDDFLIAMDGRVISGQIFSPFPFENWEKEGIRQFRVIQERRDKLTIQLAVNDSSYFDALVLENARRRLQQLFGEDMIVEFQILEKIDRDSSGKLRTTVSKVPFHWKNH